MNKYTKRKKYKKSKKYNKTKKYKGGTDALFKSWVDTFASPVGNAMADEAKSAASGIAADVASGVPEYLSKRTTHPDVAKYTTKEYGITIFRSIDDAMFNEIFNVLADHSITTPEQLLCMNPCAMFQIPFNKMNTTKITSLLQKYDISEVNLKELTESQQIALLYPINIYLETNGFLSMFEQTAHARVMRDFHPNKMAIYDLPIYYPLRVSREVLELEYYIDYYYDTKEELQNADNLPAHKDDKILVYEDNSYFRTQSNKYVRRKTIKQKYNFVDMYIDRLKTLKNIIETKRLNKIFSKCNTLYRSIECGKGISLKIANLKKEKAEIQQKYSCFSQNKKNEQLFVTQGQIAQQQVEQVRKEQEQLQQQIARAEEEKEQAKREQEQKQKKTDVIKHAAQTAQDRMERLEQERLAQIAERERLAQIAERERLEQEEAERKRLEQEEAEEAERKRLEQEEAEEAERKRLERLAQIAEQERVEREPITQTEQKQINRDDLFLDEMGTLFKEKQCKKIWLYGKQSDECSKLQRKSQKNNYCKNANIQSRLKKITETPNNLMDKNTKIQRLVKDKKKCFTYDRYNLLGNKNLTEINRLIKDYEFQPDTIDSVTNNITSIDHQRSINESTGGKKQNKTRKYKKINHMKRKKQMTKRRTKIKKRENKWSKKYKKSINCKNPRGFSQKQYCKYGKK